MFDDYCMARIRGTAAIDVGHHTGNVGKILMLRDFFIRRFADWGGWRGSPRGIRTGVESKLAIRLGLFQRSFIIRVHAPPDFIAVYGYFTRSLNRQANAAA